MIADKTETPVREDELGTAETQCQLEGCAGQDLSPRSAESIDDRAPTEASESNSQSAGTSLTVIEPRRAFQLINIRELWRFRELIYFLAWRDVKVRYKQTVLGVAWAVLQPALMMVIFTFFFSRMAGLPSGGLDYPVFVLAGLLPWTLFAGAVAAASNSVVGSERLITKIYFPRLAIPLASVGPAIVDFLVACMLLAVIGLCYAIVPGFGLLIVPVIVLGLTLAALGIGTFLAALNVAYRDFRYVVPFLLQVWMFATPAIYMKPVGEGSARWQMMLYLNPINGLVATFRAAALGKPIYWGPFAVSILTALILLFIGCLYFRRVEDTFADLI